MIKKKIFLLFICILMFLMISSCGNEGLKEPQTDQYEIYKLAQDNGYKGTYEEWLESIKGEKGDTGNGISSITKILSDGLVDTYLILFTNGDTTTFTVTNGTQGIQGVPGTDGHTPVITIQNGYWYIDGVNTNVYADASNGQNGQNGKSAYEIYIENHPEYTKSEKEWLDDLVNGVLKTKCKVTFDTDGGTKIEPQEVCYGDRIAKPLNPEKKGYIFDGWYLAESFDLLETEDISPWQFLYYTVSKDMTLKAKWIKDDKIYFQNFFNLQKWEEIWDLSNVTISGENYAEDEKMIFNAKIYDGITYMLYDNEFTDKISCKIVELYEENNLYSFMIENYDIFNYNGDFVYTSIKDEDYELYLEIYIDENNKVYQVEVKEISYLSEIIVDYSYGSISFFDYNTTTKPNIIHENVVDDYINMDGDIYEVIKCDDCSKIIDIKCVHNHEYENGECICGSEKKYTYNTYTSVSPSNWNELTYRYNNDTQILNYISGNLFEFDYKFDENGEIIPGQFVVKYSAATKLEDVTAQYAGYAAGWGIAEDATQRAWKITLRDDLKWEDGSKITAADFVYSMKEQLAPEFQNYRADSYYAGQTVIHNAENYVKQGQTIGVSARKFYSVWDASATDIYFSLNSGSVVGDWIEENYGSYLAAHTPAWVLAAIGLSVTEEQMLSIDGLTPAEIYANEEYKAIFENVLAFWQPAPNEELDLFSVPYTYPACDFSNVGIFQGENELEIVLVLDKAIKLLNEDSSLSYNCLYTFSGLPLVHKETYEANKVKPSGATKLWTSTYNSSVDSTMSWGPYKLLSFQTDKQYVLVRNENWYGYNLPENDGLYQTDSIVCETISQWGTAWLKFLAGEIDGIGIDASVSTEYKGSERAYFTPDDYVGSLQIQSIYTALKERESEGVNKTILAQEDFRKALSLGIDREEYNNVCSTSSKAGFGLFNSMHYYDVENGGVLRNTDEGRKVLCEIYNVDWQSFPGATDSEKLAAAEKTITGKDTAAAKKLIDSAVAKSIEAGDFKQGDKVVLTFGTSVINEATQRSFDYLANAFKELAVGTVLEGKLECELKDFGDKWANAFRAGEYDICIGGWTGAAWDPGYLLLAYLGDGYRYAAGWKPETVEMTFTMKGVGPKNSDITETMTLLEWYDCLNGVSSAKYDWSATALSQEKRLQLIAALEKEVLKTYYCVPIQNYFGASLLSYKLDYITYEYNTFMAYGGIKYATFNYDDAEWAKFVSENNYELNYR